ncbi:hypothetical protein [Streptomyces sp. TBY4]|uniref:hypothetical protein n=1 Tax=Streptomyces sp. TBY4 TaxID=2962030 RepID=UPI0020B8FCA9|nr:hypothetical protein [Streptomyces sp. TBY4]MCP3755733.1 hypothetical protein [Streptomyces sp. TBY4]
MALRMLGKDPNSPDGNSPTIYLDEETDRYLVQGYNVVDEERLKQLKLPPHEGAVEIPRYMVQFFLEADREVGPKGAEPEEEKGVESPDV